MRLLLGGMKKISCNYVNHNDLMKLSEGLLNVHLHVYTRPTETAVSRIARYTGTNSQCLLAVSSLFFFFFVLASLLFHTLERCLTLC